MTFKEYSAALDRILFLMDAQRTPKEDEEIDRLVSAVEKHEEPMATNGE